jgi:hypothetical protein
MVLSYDFYNIIVIFLFEKRFYFRILKTIKKKRKKPAKPSA